MFYPLIGCVEYHSGLFGMYWRKALHVYREEILFNHRLILYTNNCEALFSKTYPCPK